MQARAPEPFEQRIVDAIGNHHRQAGMNAQPLEMGNRVQPFDERGQPTIRRGQRIAAGKDRFLDRVVLAQVIECPFPLPHRRRVVGVGEVTAEAVTAIDRTGRTGNQQRPAGVFVNQPWSGRVVALFQWIIDIAPHGIAFRAQRQDLAQQGVVRIAAPDPREISQRHAHRKQIVPASGARQPFEIQPQMPAELGRVADHVAQLLLPVARRCIGHGRFGFDLFAMHSDRGSGYHAGHSKSERLPVRHRAEMGFFVADGPRTVTSEESWRTILPTNSRAA